MMDHYAEFMRIPTANLLLQYRQQMMGLSGDIPSISKIVDVSIMCLNKHLETSFPIGLLVERVLEIEYSESADDQVLLVSSITQFAEQFMLICDVVGALKTHFFPYRFLSTVNDDIILQHQHSTKDRPEDLYRRAAISHDLPASF